MSFEDYQVHREGLADAAEPDTWTRGPLPPGAREAADLTAQHLTSGYPIPLVLTVDGETAIQAADAPVPFALTPEGEAAVVTMCQPDTWTRHEPPSLRQWPGADFGPEPEV